MSPSSLPADGHPPSPSSGGNPPLLPLPPPDGEPLAGGGPPYPCPPGNGHAPSPSSLPPIQLPTSQPQTPLQQSPSSSLPLTKSPTSSPESGDLNGSTNPTTAASPTGPAPDYFIINSLRRRCSPDEIPTDGKAKIQVAVMKKYSLLCIPQIRVIFRKNSWTIWDTVTVIYSHAFGLRFLLIPSNCENILT